MVFPIVALFVVWLAVNNRFAAFYMLATTKGTETTPTDAAGGDTATDPAKAAKDALGMTP